MQRIINIRNENAIKEIANFKEKRFSMTDIKFQNVHLKKINELVRLNVFLKNDLFINSSTLWELMQPVGLTGSHNHHGLTPEDVLSALLGLSNPFGVFIAKNGRYLIVPVMTSSFNMPLLVVIETRSDLVNDKNAKANKIVTIYPSSKLKELLKQIKSKDVLFIKK